MITIWYIVHSGVSKRDGAKIGSGRYPLGSGDRPYQHGGGSYSGKFDLTNKQRLSNTKEMLSKGVTKVKQAFNKATYNTKWAQNKRTKQWNKEHEEFVNNRLTYYQKNPKKQAKFLKDINSMEANKEQLDDYGHMYQIVNDRTGDWYNGELKNKKAQELYNKKIEIFDDYYRNKTISKEEYINKEYEITREMSKIVLKDLGFKITPANLSYVYHLWAID